MQGKDEGLSSFVKSDMNPLLHYVNTLATHKLAGTLLWAFSLNKSASRLEAETYMEEPMILAFCLSSDREAGLLVQLLGGIHCCKPCRVILSYMFLSCSATICKTFYRHGDWGLEKLAQPSMPDTT